MIPGPRLDGPVGRGLWSGAERDLSRARHHLALLVGSVCLLDAYSESLLPFTRFHLWT